jgi:D-alanyl-D-alanine-carboxypeptidase/D-alanyl-D-alanine-endopeptidase
LQRLVILLLACLAFGERAYAQFTDTEQQRIAEKCQFLVDHGGYPSITVGVVRGNNLIYARAFGVKDRASKSPATVDTLYKVGSVGKVFTATLLMMMRDSGKLNLDDPVERYLPDGVHLQHDSKGEDSITFRHLATHSSGLPEWPTDDPKVYDPDPSLSNEERFAAFTKDRLEFPIGARFRYSGDGYSLLGIALERLGGDSYENLLRKKLFEPLGMRDTVITVTNEQRSRIPHQYAWDGAEVNKDPAEPGDQWEFATSAHFSDVPDMAKFLSVQLRAGTNGLSPVSGGTLRQMQTPQRLQNNWDDAIGMGWWIEPNTEIGDIVWHKGGSRGFGSYVALSQRFQIGVVLFTNRNRSLEEVGRWLSVRAALDLGLPGPPTKEEADKYFKWRDWRNAQLSYAYLVKAQPNDPESWYRYAATLQRTHQCERAIAAFRRAAELGRNHGESNYSIARCDLELGHTDEALNELTRAVERGFKDEDGELTTDGLFEPLSKDDRFLKLVSKLHP